MIAGWPEIPPGVVQRWILVRHGEPEASAHGRCYGKLDVGLSERGREQIRNTSRWLAPAPIAAVYTSPRRRARESAEILAARCDAPVRVDARFAEIDFGELEGRTYDEVAEKYPELYRAWMERPTEVEFPGGESFTAMRRRVLDAAAELRQEGDPIMAVVTHGGVNRILLAEALGMAGADIFRIDQSYGAVSVIDLYYGDTPVVRLLNGTC